VHFVASLGVWRRQLFLHRGRNEIANYFLERESSGFVEGLNNKIKVLKRRCYGIFNLNHLRQRLRLDLDGYALFWSLCEMLGEILKTIIFIMFHGRS